MAITDIFYTDNCKLMRTVVSEPDEYGVCTKTTELISSLYIPCSFSPISTVYAQNKYGISIQQSFEVTLNVDNYINVQEVDAILVNGESYEVVSYQVFSEFMILPASVTFLVKKV